MNNLRTRRMYQKETSASRCSVLLTIGLSDMQAVFLPSGVRSKQSTLAARKTLHVTIHTRSALLLSHFHLSTNGITGRPLRTQTILVELQTKRMASENKTKHVKTEKENSQWPYSIHCRRLCACQLSFIYRIPMILY